MTTNKKLQAWVEEWAQLCQPDKVYWCDGSEEENQRLLDEMVAAGSAVKLNDEKQPGSYYFQSDPSDVARVENRTYICTNTKEEAAAIEFDDDFIYHEIYSKMADRKIPFVHQLNYLDYSLPSGLW